MKRFATLALCCACALTSPTHAQTSHYAGDPLLLGAGARALGMGSAYVALSFDATAVYWNPAGLAPEVYNPGLDINSSQLKREIHLQHAEQFGGSVNHDIFASRLPIRKGGIGLGIVRAGVDGIALTGLEDPDRPIGPDNRPVIIDKIGTADYVFRIAYGRHITDKLRLGAGIKMIRRDLNVGVGTGFGLDIGLLYLPTSAFRIGATIRDLTKTRIAFPDGIADHISPSLLIGSAFQRRVPGGLMTVGFSTHLNDKKSAQEKARSIQLGIEYRLQHRLAFRLGYKDGHFTAGTGLQLRRFGVDLAFMEHDQLDNTYRISALYFFDGTVMAFKSGYVIIAGRTNVGKSTLFNALVGERLSIISPKPQTTRNNILGIVTDKQAQMIFLDTPGILSARYRLHEFMNRQIGRAYQSADVLLGIVDGSEFDTSYDAEVRQIFGQWDIPKIIAINKTDLISRQQAQHCEKHIRASLTTQTVLSVAAISGQGIQDLHTALRHALPEGPQYYPEDTLTEQPERFFVAELIREEVFHHLRQELPYATAIDIEAFEENRPKVYIQANIIVERNSQKGIVIGRGGKTLKTIGQQARKKIEAFLERPIYLDLHVKVYENWRKKDTALRSLGYGLS